MNTINRMIRKQFQTEHLEINLRKYLVDSRDQIFQTKISDKTDNTRILG